jgi:transcriptional regulator with XRE-family HTH domain
MNAALEPIAAILRAARERKGWTQRELGHRVGLPQSHLSKIENAAVDLQLSSLMEIARALDLELALVPRTLLPAIRALQRTSGSKTGGPDAPDTSVPAYQLGEEDGSD